MAEIDLDKTSQKVRDLFNKGFTAFERGNLDYAIDLLSACVKMEPALLQARKFLRAAEIRKFKQKSNPLTRVISTIACLPLFLKTVAMVKSKNTNEALVSAEELLKDNPLNSRFIKVFAQAAVNANLPEAAIQTLEIARDHYPNNILIINWLGALYQKVGRTRSARECFEKLSEIRPDDPAALKSLKDAMALDSMTTDGWVESAEKGGTYRDIIKDVKEAALLEQEAKAVKSEKDVDVLIADIRAKISGEPENINYYRALARLYVQKKLFDEAIAIMEKAREISPNDPELGNVLSSIHIQQFDNEIFRLKAEGDTAGAEAKKAERDRFVFENLKESVRRYPNDLKLRHEWGVILYENGNLNEAIQQFQMSQKSPKHRVDSLYYLAMCFRKKKQYDMALEQLEKAASEIPTMDGTKKDIFYEIGEISEAMGNRDKAAEYYKQIYQVDIGYKDIAEKIERVYNK